MLLQYLAKVIYIAILAFRPKKSPAENRLGFFVRM